MVYADRFVPFDMFGDAACAVRDTLRYGVPGACNQRGKGGIWGKRISNYVVLTTEFGRGTPKDPAACGISAYFSDFRADCGITIRARMGRAQAEVRKRLGYRKRRDPFPRRFAPRVSRRINGRTIRPAPRLCAPHVCLSFLI